MIIFILFISLSVNIHTFSYRNIDGFDDRALPSISLGYSFIYHKGTIFPF